MVDDIDKDNDGPFDGLHDSSTTGDLALSCVADIPDGAPLYSYTDVEKGC